MHRLSKMLSCILVLCLAFGLTACDSKKTEIPEYVPPVGGYYVEETESVQTEPPIVETEPPVEETIPPETEAIEIPTEPVETKPVISENLTRLEKIRKEHEENIEFYINYSNLNDRQKEIYLRIYEALDSGEQFLKLPEEFYSTLDESTMLMFAVNCDHPEIFYLDSTKKYYVGDEVRKLEFLYFPEFMANLEENKSRLNQTVDLIVSKTEGKSLLDREKIYHDYICKSSTYILNKYDQTVWSCLINRETVCAGYAKAFQLLMMRSGVPCYYIVGTMDTGTEIQPHAWNIVKLVDGYYMVDVTSDDANENDTIIYTHYNIAFNEVDNVYTIDERCSHYPMANDTRYSFENMYGIDRYIASAKSFVDTEDVMYSIEDFKSFFEKSVSDYGFGEYTLKYVAVGENVQSEIANYINSDEATSFLRGIMDRSGYKSANIATNSTISHFNNAYAVQYTITLTGS